jgi:hypothetical protein
LGLEGIQIKYFLQINMKNILESFGGDQKIGEDLSIFADLQFVKNCPQADI